MKSVSEGKNLMSKFSKAIEKIEDLRRLEREDLSAHSENPVPSLHLPPEEPGENGWDKDIKTLRNLKPDNRVVAYHFPDSMISEQYRMLRTNLKNDLLKTNAHVILVSSAIWGEGKTVTSTNLAMILSEEKEVKVALIDADLRRGKIAEYMGLDKKRPGLTKFLSEEIDPRDVLLRNSRSNLAIMPCGESVKNPSTLLNSPKFRLLIAELRTHYDYIIIDSPPIMSVSDAGIMCRYVDGILFIIQIGRTPKSLIAHSNLLFKQAGARMLGYILTNVEYHSADYRYYDKYDYYGPGDDDLEKIAKRKQKRIQYEKTSLRLQNAEERFTNWWRKLAGRSSKEWQGT